MCCCGKPTINGQKGVYSWDGKSFSTRPVDPPDLQDGDELVYDGPGRCGGIDSHCHHFRIVKHYSSYDLLVRHGGGDERIRIGGCRNATVQTILALSENDRYWMCQMIDDTARHASREAVQKNDSRWRIAFLDGRLKKRKRQGRVSVEFLPVVTHKLS